MTNQPDEPARPAEPDRQKGADGGARQREKGVFWHVDHNRRPSVYWTNGADGRAAAAKRPGGAVLVLLPLLIGARRSAAVRHAFTFAMVAAAQSRSRLYRPNDLTQKGCCYAKR